MTDQDPIDTAEIRGHFEHTQWLSLDRSAAFKVADELDTLRARVAELEADAQDRALIIKEQTDAKIAQTFELAALAEANDKMREALKHTQKTAQAFLDYFNPIIDLPSAKEDQWWAVHDQLERNKAALSLPDPSERGRLIIIALERATAVVRSKIGKLPDVHCALDMNLEDLEQVIDQLERQS